MFHCAVGAALGGLSAVALIAQEPAPAEYVQAMQDIRAASQTLGQFAETQNFEAAAEAAEIADPHFLYVQTFWTERGDQEAADLAYAGLKAAQDICVAAGLLSAAGVTYAADQMTGTCGTCHMAHRVRLEKGGFAIQ